MKKLFIICFCFMFQFAVVSSSHAGWFDDIIDWVDGAANDTADWFDTAYDDVANWVNGAYGDVAEAAEIVGNVAGSSFMGLYDDAQRLLGIYDDGTDPEYLGSRTVKVLTMQTRLDKYAPINKAGFPHTHNSFNAAPYRTAISYLYPNHEMSVLNQMNVGIRALEYDIHWYDGDVILCHNGGSGVCSPDDRSFAQGLEEIKYWFQVEEHRLNDVIILTLEDHLDGHYDEAVTVIEAVIGYLVYQPETPCDSFQDMAAVTSKADVLADGKNIIIINSNSSSCTQNGYGDYVYTGNWETADHENLTPYPDCTFGTKGPSDIKNSFFRTYNDSTAFVGEEMSAEQVARAVKCGINAPGPEPLDWWDDQNEAQIWSWAVDEPNDAGGNEDCAEQRSDGRFNDIPCTGYPRNYACQHPETRDWKITAVSGAWADGENACDDGDGYVFSVPANGYENAQLADTKNAAGVSNVWVNYSDLALEGDWRPGDWQPADILSVVLNIEGTNDMNSSLTTDWRYGHYKADCPDGLRMIGMAKGDERALCSNDGTGDLTDNVNEYTAVVGSQSYGDHTGTDWAYGYVKYECPVGYYVSGYSYSTSLNFDGVLCTKANRQPNSAYTVNFNSSNDGYDSSLAGDWAYGYYKGQCDRTGYVAGIARTTSDNKPAVLLCVDF
ncbi:MAG: hypothetical protein GY795_28730 [Desulfobacterales bacterium]|nr:hypothetical protein [Desulfobacterales bacterium]